MAGSDSQDRKTSEQERAALRRRMRTYRVTLDQVAARVGQCRYWVYSRTGGNPPLRGVRLSELQRIREVVDTIIAERGER